MKRKISLLIFSLALMLVLGSIEQVLACTCNINVSTCQRYGSSDMIFIGKAIGVKKEERMRDESGKKMGGERESTIFEVEESFIGSKKKEITVQNRSGFSCDTAFQQGETYLIFAHGNEKDGFRTSLCSGNTLITSAQEILDELRNLPKAGSGGKLYGQATESLKKRDEEYVPMPGVKIKIQEVGGKRKIYNVVTDKEGKYEIILPQGKYRILPTIPAYAEFVYMDEDPIFVKDRGCVEESFGIENKSQISGKLIDSDGKPVSKGDSLFGIRLELISIDLIEKPTPFEDDGYGSIADDGTFTINNIPVGKYTLSVNYTRAPSEESPFPTVFYPGSPDRAGAEIFEVGLGQTISGIVFRLPPRLAERKVQGTITFEDGTPAANIDLYLEDSERPGFCVNGCNDQTDSAGNFELYGYAGREYRIKAKTEKEIDGKKIEYNVTSETFFIYESSSPIKLVLKKSEKKEDQDQ